MIQELKRNRKEEFPILNSCNFMNHAAVSPLPKCTIDAISDFLNGCKEDFVGNYEKWWKRVKGTKELFGQLFNCSYKEIAYVKNTTQGILFASNGIDFKPGDNVIIPDCEFPANVYPWTNLKEKGVEVKFVPEKDGCFLIEDFERLINSRTKAISVSFVEFTTGFKNDVERLGEICKEKEIFFVVDGIQGVGAIPIDVKKCNIDLMSLDGHKWLLGPEGIGVMYVSEEAMEKLKVPSAGYAGVMDYQNYLKYFQPLDKSARRFEEGTLNLLGIYALYASVNLILKAGVENIYKELMKLTSFLYEGLLRKGYKVLTPMGENERSGIITFVSEKYDCKYLFNILKKNKILVAMRRERIRLSPHFYNCEEDIEQVIDVLP